MGMGGMYGHDGRHERRHVSGNDGRNTARCAPSPLQMSVSPMATQTAGAIANNNPADQTGMYLGNNAYQQQNGPRVPHVIPNPFDNTILIQGTPQEYEQILSLLRQLDIPPRQVLIDAKIYEVDLNGAFAAGVTAFLEKKDGSHRGVQPHAERGHRRGRRAAEHGRPGAAQPRTAGGADGVGDQRPHPGALRAEHHRDGQHPGVVERG